jgi:trigger factor
MTKVSMETVDSIRRRLAVEVPAVEVTAEIERAYDQLRRTANVRGFRPGRAPRPVLQQLFGDRVEAEVFGKLVQDSYGEALREQNIEPVGQPEIVTERAEPGEPLRYSATVEVKPLITPSGYAGLKADRPLKPVRDQDVDEFLEHICQSYAQLVPIVDRTRAARGDVATVDYEARIDGSLVGRGEDRQLLVGSEDELGARLEGAEKAVDLELDIDYPDDHGNRELAGRRVHFRVRVKSLFKREVPDLDDDFAKDHGESDTLAGLKERARQHLEATAARDADEATRSALVDQLIRAHPVEVPRAMVERRTESMVEDFLESLGPRRPPAGRENEVRVQLRAEFEPRASDQVKAGLILEAIAQHERIEIADEEIEAQVDRVAERAGSAKERVRALYQDASARAALRAKMLQTRALELVTERATIRTVERTSAVADDPGNG